MSISSEEDFIVSQEANTDRSSNVEDSFTAKLDNMLHSSDEVIVQNADFFKASSNEVSENDEVSESSHSDGHSVPKLEFEERNRGSKSYLEYKSGESYTSLGTVVRHETPKIGQRKIKVFKVPRPASAKNRKPSLAPRDDTNEQEFADCLQKISRRHPEFSKMIKNEKNDFGEYFKFKVSQFNHMLEGHIGVSPSSTQERNRLRNKEKDKKREEIRAKLQEEELERMKTSNMKYKENNKKRLKHLIESTLKKFQKLKVIEDAKLAKEAKQKKMSQKQVVIENIKTYYENKIQIFREKMNERKMFKIIYDQEHKLIFAENQKKRKKEGQIAHERNINMLKKQAEDIDMRNEAEKTIMHKKIVQLYKNSIKSIRKMED